MRTHTNRLAQVLVICAGCFMPRGKSPQQGFVCFFAPHEYTHYIPKYSFVNFNIGNKVRKLLSAANSQNVAVLTYLMCPHARSGCVYFSLLVRLLGSHHAPVAGRHCFHLTSGPSDHTPCAVRHSGSLTEHTHSQM